MITLIKANIYMGLPYRIRGLVHYQQGREHVSKQADMVLEKELRVLHPDAQVVERERHWTWIEPLKPKSPLPLSPTRPQLPKQDRTS